MIFDGRSAAFGSAFPWRRDLRFQSKGVTVNRADWQRTADEKLRDAHSLLAAGRWASAYYLAGYAVECGLKACILVRLATAPELVFEVRGFSEKCWTHDAEKLVELAGVKAIRDADVAVNSALEYNWVLAKDWNENSRYDPKSQTDAENLYNAIADPTNGVMQWIRVRW